MLVLTLVLAAGCTLTQAESRPTDPPLVMRIPDVQAAWGALGTTGLARLLADEEAIALCRLLTGRPDATPLGLLSEVIEGAMERNESAPTAEMFAAIDSLGLAFGSLAGTFDRPRREWADAVTSGEGQFALVMHLADADAAGSWTELIELAIEDAEDSGSESAVAPTWSVDGGRGTLRLGGCEVGVDPESLDAALAWPESLPRSKGTVMGEFWLAPVPAEFLGDWSPHARALVGAGGLVFGLPFAVGPNGARARVVLRGGVLVVDEVHSIVDPLAEGVLATRPLSPGALALAHPEAWLATVASLDHRGLAQILEGLVDEESSAAIIDSLGKDIAISVPPIRGLLQIPAMYVSAEHTDQGALSAGLEVLLTRLVELSDGAIELKRAEYRGADLFSLVLADLELVAAELQTIAAMLKITVAVTGERVVITTSVAAAKKEIRRLRKDGAVHTGLATIEAPGDAASISYVDWGAGLTQVYTLGLFLASLQGSIERADLPSPAIFARHLPPGFRWTAVREGRRVHHAETSVDTFDLLVGAGVGTVVVVPLLMGSTREAERGVAMAGVHSLKDSVTEHIIDTMSLPRDLDDLVRNSAALSADPERLIDPWGQPYRYVPGEGLDFEVWSVGPNGIDEMGEGDDVTIER